MNFPLTDLVLGSFAARPGFEVDPKYSCKPSGILTIKQCFQIPCYVYDNNSTKRQRALCFTVMFTLYKDREPL